MPKLFNNYLPINVKPPYLFTAKPVKKALGPVLKFVSSLLPVKDKIWFDIFIAFQFMFPEIYRMSILHS